jgi:hypothetical protein
MTEDELTELDREWSMPYDSILQALHEFGVENQFGKGDNLLMMDNCGQKRHQVEVHKLHMLRPVVIKVLQALLRDFPAWEIVVAVDIPGTEGQWPHMGLRVQAGRIIDDLQRQYLPAEFQNVRYE